ncbi:MAG: hypothetical protein IKB64_06040 [Paludibacteraceae bacterium]|nr:hypothetical protein [Paludibacteraceae bacterium]MBR2492998.1 hypothetical protein [Paludibacteraceae bacterium]MBR6641069.1 hypothetical protein [Clostridia bacterium]
MSRKKIDSRINKYNNFLKVDSVTGEVKGQINNIEIEEIYINSDGKLLQDTINISKETDVVPDNERKSLFRNEDYSILFLPALGYYFNDDNPNKSSYDLYVFLYLISQLQLNKTYVYIENYRYLAKLLKIAPATLYKALRSLEYYKFIKRKDNKIEFNDMLFQGRNEIIDINSHVAYRGSISNFLKTLDSQEIPYGIEDRGSVSLIKSRGK